MENATLAMECLFMVDNLHRPWVHIMTKQKASMYLWCTTKQIGEYDMSNKHCWGVVCNIGVSNIKSSL